MAESFSGVVDIVDAGGKISIQLDANAATASVGRNGRGGVLIVRDSAGGEALTCDGASAAVRIGSTRNAGDLIVRDGEGRNIFRVNGEPALLSLGAQENGGEISVRDDKGREVFHFNADAALLRIGTTGSEGDLSIRDASDRQVLQFSALNAVLRVGAEGNEGDINVRDIDGNDSIRLNGGTGDIILRNADVAEQFGVAEAVDAAPGTVMALARDGLLVPAACAYHRAVVGVVAGGGRYRSGIVMDHRADGGGRRVPIAMVGKAACRVDARHGPIRVGDLLTSSPTPGCAMAAVDPARAFGTVIGKALTPLDDGTGLVEMIISLQ